MGNPPRLTTFPPGLGSRRWDFFRFFRFFPAFPKAFSKAFFWLLRESLLREPSCDGRITLVSFLSGNGDETARPLVWGLRGTINLPNGVTPSRALKKRAATNDNTKSPRDQAERRARSTKAKSAFATGGRATSINRHDRTPVA